MPKSPNEDLINRLLGEMAEQREILEKAKKAKQIIRELNRLIAVLGGEAPEIDDDEDETEPRPKRARKTPLPGYHVIPPNEDGSYTCPECNDRYKNGPGLSAHRRAKHGVEGSYSGR